MDRAERGRRIRAWLVVALALGLTACAAGVNSQVGVPSAEGFVAGFWRGLWHGLIAPIVFLISLFSDNVSVYEVHNNGGWYDFGFLFGLSIFFGGGGHGTGRSARRR